MTMMNSMSQVLDKEMVMLAQNAAVEEEGADVGKGTCLLFMNQSTWWWLPLIRHIRDSNLACQVSCAQILISIALSTFATVIFTKILSLLFNNLVRQQHLNFHRQRPICSNFHPTHRLLSQHEPDTRLTESCCLHNVVEWKSMSLLWETCHLTCAHPSGVVVLHQVDHIKVKVMDVVAVVAVVAVVVHNHHGN
jgi:hypothetical protein